MVKARPKLRELRALEVIEGLEELESVPPLPWGVREGKGEEVEEMDAPPDLDTVTLNVGSTEEVES